MQPKDETNHIFYKTWKDLGGNIGVECTFNHAKFPVTFWTGEEKPAELFADENNPDLRNVKPCFNCQAIIKANVLQLENQNHKNEQEGEECQHQPSQLE